MTTSERILSTLLLLVFPSFSHAQEINNWEDGTERSTYGEDISKDLSIEYYEDNGTFFHNWNGILDESAEADSLTNDYIVKEMERTKVEQVDAVFRLNGQELHLPTMVNEDGIDMYLLTEEGATIYMALNPPAYWNEIYGDVMKWIRFYAYKHRERTSRMFARYTKWERYFHVVFASRGIPAETALLCLVESACTSNAVSKAGAAGMWQIMPETGRGFGMKINSQVDERFDPVISTEYAAKILANDYRLTGNWTLTLAAYNCGAARVSRTAKRMGTKDWLILKDCLPEETRQYVPAIMALYYIWTYKEKLNF